MHLSFMTHHGALFSITVLLTTLQLPSDTQARRRTRTIAAKPAAGKGTQSPKTSQSDDEAAAERTGEQDEREMGPSLAERIKAVTHRRYSKRFRFNIGPRLGASLNDPFYRSLLAGINLGFNITETLAIGAIGEYTLYNMVARSVRVIGRPQSRTRADYYRPWLFGYLSMEWAPIYGKLSLMAEKTVHFDIFLVGGAGISGMQSGIDTVSNPPPRLSFYAGVGGRYFMAKGMALRWEITDRMLGGARSIAPIPGTEEQSLQHFICLMLAADFFMP